MKRITYIYQILIFLGVFFTGMVSSTLAQPVPEQTNPPHLVVDEAGIFSQGEVQRLERELVAFSDTTSNQIVVVTMSDLQDYQPWEVAQNIGQKWGVGQKGFDNGVVILIKPKVGNSRGQVNIQVGYGLEGAIPDATTKMIVENEMIPYFKSGNMYQGVANGVEVIKSLAVGEYNSDAYANNSGGSGKGSFMPFLFILLVLAIVLISRAREARRYGRTNNLPFWAALMMLNQTRGYSGSFGNFTSGGGGFGGFGGGGFGGGGAGGSW